MRKRDRFAAVLFLLLGLIGWMWPNALPLFFIFGIGYFSIEAFDRRTDQPGIAAGYVLLVTIFAASFTLTI